MSNIIYIALVIGWVILNIVRAAKKAQKAKAPQPASAPTESRDLKTILMEKGRELEKRLNEGWESETESVENSYDEQAFDTEVIYADGKAHDYSEVESSLQKFNEKYAEISEAHSSHLISEQDAKEDHGSLEDDFDLSKAVIYSEILKRPAY